MDTKVTFLQDCLTPTYEVSGIRYFDAEKIIVLATAISDFGRDYYIDNPNGTPETGKTRKLATAIEKLCSHDWELPNADNKILTILSEMPQLAYTVLKSFDHFTYYDQRDGNSADYRTFDIDDSAHRDIPEDVIGRFAAAHFSSIKREYLKLRTNSEFIGEIKGKLNGLELAFFDSQAISPRNTYYDSTFYLHQFFDADNHLVVWKSGINAKFEREGKYTLIGGSVKAHDSYQKDAKKTIITRARFFDHQTGEKYVG